MLRLAEAIEGEFPAVSAADYAQRPDLRQLALNNRADPLQITSARSVRLPQVNANALLLVQKPSHFFPDRTITPPYAVVSVNLLLVHWKENRLLET